MHRCLMILDVLLMIFESLDLSKRDLARLARTCKLFCSPALDVLWRDQQHLLVLLKCLPPDLWKNEDGTETRLILRRPVVAEDWTRFVAYANRMRTLALGDANHDQPTPTLDLWDSSALLTAPGFPVLHTIKALWVDVTAPDSILLWFRLASRLSVESLEILNPHGLEPSEFGASFLSNLPSVFPNVRFVSFHSNSPSYVLSEAIVDVICNGYPNLYEFIAICNELSARDLIALSALPSLSTITLDWNGAEDTEVLKIAAPQPCFLAARYLMMHVYDASSVDTFSPILGMAQWPQLESLIFSLATDAASPVSAWNSLIAKLASVSSPTAFQFIALDEIANTPASRSSPESLDIGTLEPLLIFRHLVEFHCDPACGFDLGDTDIEKIAHGWPSLRVLQLEGWSRPSRITMSGLMSLIRLCPDLDRLSIGINATSNDISPSDGLATVNRKLTHLYLGNSEIEDPSAVAPILSASLPNLRSFGYWSHSRHEVGVSPTEEEIEQYRTRWKEVETALQLPADGSRI
ncbi:hypothetical protein PLICRDRAFT_380502 [Plicaturopsis crispa FD-325 SS-3]|nr:hypothetical protein PLICRDRAFT_380502 [Plicaturopsis crispa FD-325 SS-3]